MKEWLEKLKWDGKNRISFVSEDVLGSKDYLDRDKVTQLFKDALRRVYHPGCKLKKHLVLVGPQGIGKSAFLRNLFGQWYEDFRFDGGEIGERTADAWGAEFDPGQLNKKGKAWLSATSDTVRPEYGKRAGKHPRRCVFVGTTNDIAFLHGPGRRFSVVHCGQIRLAKLNVRQVWAEAMHYWGW
ncbi:MAG: VapE domain-containing protein [Elusimicrobiota bacterium]